jgi:hypothetical protein
MAFLLASIILERRQVCSIRFHVSLLMFVAQMTSYRVLSIVPTAYPVLGTTCVWTVVHRPGAVPLMTTCMSLERCACREVLIAIPARIWLCVLVHVLVVVARPAEGDALCTTATSQCAGCSIFGCTPVRVRCGSSGITHCANG